MAISNKDKNLIIADFLTGKYSQRELSKKYDVSLGTINKLTKDLEQKNEHLVNAQVSILRAKQELDPLEMNAIMNTANQLSEYKDIIDKATLKNISHLAKKINEGSSIIEHKIAQDTFDKASITLNVNSRHAKSGDVNVNATAAVQNNIAPKALDDFYDA